MSPLGRRVRTPLLAALTTVLVVGGAVASLGAGAADGPSTLSNATLEWSFNEELNTGAFDGSCNHLSAGTTDGSAAQYRGVDGDVTIQKRTAAGTYATISDWATRCHDANGVKVTPGGTARLGLRIRMTGGDGTHDPATGVTTVQWTGSFSTNLYDELVPLWFSNLRLVVDAAGNGTLTATMAGYASSLDNPDVREQIPPLAGVVIARFTGLATAGATGFTATPRYAGVLYESTEAPQVRNTPSWGSWPTAMVDATVRTGTSAYWYSTGGGADVRKPPAPVTVAFGPMVAPSTTTTTTSTPSTTSTSTPPTSTVPPSTSSTTTVPGATTSTTTSTVPPTSSSTTTSTTTSVPPTSSSSTTTSTNTSVPTTSTTTSTTAAPPVPTTTIDPAPSTTVAPAPETVSPSEVAGAAVAQGTTGSANTVRTNPLSSTSRSTSSSAQGARTTDDAAPLAATDVVAQDAPVPEVAAGRTAPDAPVERKVRKVDASLRYTAMTSSYRPSWNPAAPGSVEVTYTVENTGEVTVAARRSTEVSTSFGPNPDVAEARDMDPLAPGRTRTLTEVVDGVWPGFGTETVVRLEPYVPSDPDLDLAAATITARTSSTVWPWQQLVGLVLLAAAAGTGFWAWRRHRAAAA